MLSHILCKAQEFERNHGIAPNVMYINPMHFEVLFREYPELFEPGQEVRLGFRLMIVPGSRLAHPDASWLENLRPLRAGGNRSAEHCRDVAIGLPVVA